ncbi:hypothetical protein CHLNCDRAFT_141008 [Chlorella variabilis]|uniref:methylated diphthine methylhydrolase n=1 Tax=Chlorella variabilis TaxID=554065 RepID=E1ZRZ2_CHLVA|nr:hypothetical protein CHLNCDRAFT_141008 [Chlorella variabilis]EFN51390.1 hypothetical protein CHLNCDRAFT_141008 [Chlorella variabilis]|eukprot:XP_005843492.1 hypothetical protein CHLNCDRAFT_141008 [Chlorella variabilis]
MPATRCLERRELPLPADVAEWCPHPAALRVLAAGTYQLDEASGQRRGGLHVFRLAGGALQPLPPAGALDLPGDRRTHGAGVTCVASSPFRQYDVCTGSYDDRLRLWDLRAPARPLLCAELDTSGGVWRAKWHPADPGLLLVACMYRGFAAVRLEGGAAAHADRAPAEAGAGAGAGGAAAAAVAAGAAGERGGACGRPRLAVVARYEHQPGSLSYGADWCRDPTAAAEAEAAAAAAAGAAAAAEGAGGDEPAAAATGGEEAEGGCGCGDGSGGAWLAATASFYDRQLHLWRLQL